MNDPYNSDDGLLEDMASAIGHVVLSHNSMQLALKQVALHLWPDSNLDEIAQLFGRRSVDERLKMIAQQLNANRRLLPDWTDRLDRLLATCRHLNDQRNQLVHSLSSLPMQSAETDRAGPLADYDFDFDRAVALSDKLDATALALLGLCAVSNQ